MHNHQNSLGIPKIHKLSRSQHSLPCRVLSARHAVLSNIGQHVWRITKLLNSKLGPVLYYFIFCGYQYQRKEEKWHRYILTYINLPLWSWWQLNLFPERKEGPLSLKSFLKLKITFSVKKKNAVNMTYPTILIATMLLVKGLLSDTVEEEAGQKKLKIKKISCKSNNFAEA